MGHSGPCTEREFVRAMAELLHVSPRWFRKSYLPEILATGRESGMLLELDV